VLEKMTEELAELRSELETTAIPARLTEELGDLLFACVNLARHLAVDPESALRLANLKFERRFRRIEHWLKVAGRTPQQAGLAELDALWERGQGGRTWGMTHYFRRKRAPGLRPSRWALPALSSECILSAHRCCRSGRRGQCKRRLGADFQQAAIAVEKEHIQRNKGVFHPEGGRSGLRLNKEHAVIEGHPLAKHQSLLSLLESFRNFDMEAVVIDPDDSGARSPAGLTEYTGKHDGYRRQQVAEAAEPGGNRLG